MLIINVSKSSGYLLSIFERWDWRKHGNILMRSWNIKKEHQECFIAPISIQKSTEQMARMRKNYSMELHTDVNFNDQGAASVAK